MKILGKYPSVRLRRNRKYDWVRRLVAENNLTNDDLISVGDNIQAAVTVFNGGPHIKIS